MADNWSSSVVTLTNAGDWCKWSFDLDATSAARLNGASLSTLEFQAIRTALSAASRSGILAVIVNDVLAENLGTNSPQSINSTVSWVSANRFGVGQALTAGGFRAIDFPYLRALGTNIPGAGPFIAGTNTIRLLWMGRNDDGAAEPLEVDFMFLYAAAYGPFGTVDIGNETTAETKPVVGVPYATSYDAHVNPDPWFNSDTTPTWILKAPQASTGTAAASTLEVTKFCPHGGDVTAIMRVTGGGAPLSGVAGLHTTEPTTTITTLDGNGRATFTFAATYDAVFWYGGNDNWAPATVPVDRDSRFGCNGWNLHQIGMSPSS